MQKQQNEFGDIDFSKFETWQKVVAPNGAVYYQVPNSGYLYDPAASKLQGRPVLFINPGEPVKPPGLLEQLTPTAIGIGATIGAQKAANHFFPSSPTATSWDPRTGQVLMSDGSITQGGINGAPVQQQSYFDKAYEYIFGKSDLPVAQTPPGVAVEVPNYAGAGNAATTSADAFSAGLGAANATSGIDAIASTPFTYGAGAADAASTGYTLGGGIEALPDYSALGLGSDAATAASTGIEAAGGATEAGAVPTGGFGDYLPGIGAALGAYNLASNWGNSKAKAGPAALSGAAIGTYFLPGIGTAIGAALGAASTQFGKDNTNRDVEKQRWNRAGKEDYQNYFLEDQFSGKESDLGIEQLRINPDNYNNAPDWDSWTKKQQDAFLQDIYENKKYDWRKGGIYYDDQYAKELANRIRNENPQTAGTAPQSKENEYRLKIWDSEVAPKMRAQLEAQNKRPEVIERIMQKRRDEYARRF